MTAQKRTFSRGGIRPAQAHEKNGLDRAKTGAQNDPMKIGYARVSREDQNPDYQRDALKTAGCSEMFEDRQSGADFTRAGLDAALAAVRPGGELVVWKLDRLGRSMLETVHIVLKLDRRDVGFRSLTESFDTKTPLGRGVLALLAAVAEDERERLRERTRAGLTAARRRGKRLGRPPAITPEKLEWAARLIAEGKEKAVAARMIGVDPATLRRALNS
jgi:DNA invertase Pin-like site-specific DNA recombinase